MGLDEWNGDGQPARISTRTARSFWKIHAALLSSLKKQWYYLIYVYLITTNFSLIKQSYYTLLDHRVPKIEVLVFAIQLIIGYQGQILGYPSTEVLPISADFSWAGEGPEGLLQGQSIFVVFDGLF